MNRSSKPGQVHEGRNVKRFREMMGYKQEGLAYELGDDWNQKKISLLEQKETIEPSLLDEIAKALKVPVEAIRNFNEDAAVSIINNTFTSDNCSAGYIENFNPNFNPLEKYLDAIDENKKLYERLLESEREKVALLENLLKNK